MGMQGRHQPPLQLCRCLAKKSREQRHQQKANQGDAATGDQAQATEAVEAVITRGGDEVTAVGFNPHYLSDALGALTQPYVQFSFTAPGKPCLVQGLPELDGEPDADYRHVIMLMRLPG